jgi:DNA-directed RNA polymerase subunit RPC12/RpoP
MMYENNLSVSPNYECVMCGAKADVWQSPRKVMCAKCAMKEVKATQPKKEKLHGIV